MISYKCGVVTDIIKEDEHVDIIYVNIKGEKYKAVNYSDFTGKVKINDKVVLNTTAVELKLGTGGYHFVMYNYSNNKMDLQGPGHIMKLRYTPFQVRCLVAEEEDSPYHTVFQEFTNLENHIFIVGTLHSMIGPIAAMIKYLNQDIEINYIMTDGGALPIFFSNTVSELKLKGLLKNTITIGHAFGGDLECINIYTGLIAAKEILRGHVTIISMGPGIVGSGTKYGFTGIEQGYIIDVINNLGGFSIAVPRISFQDRRIRHRGISHHTLTVLSEIINTKTNIVLPTLDKEKGDFILRQIESYELNKRHNIIYSSGELIHDAMKKFDLKTTSMGRTIEEDPEYFLTLGSIGKYVVKLIEEREGYDV
ncbi:MAG: DUF3866 family protein [Tissierellia bacterium]|nr:DUF3866 family protein [Tissierellia bacterium]